ncbi:hypothetical protein HDG36_001937 [Paraburkholderia sp. Kb1A]|uniref:hypothetical protein n=1 Tax=unclassified Paraburkholderia TaxID=2615204 RepID=UPI00161261F4|nr:MULTISPECIES: hypothetical protein [unclassified Paraburkholderia]MBB5450401.1 hypothetical protein [Paraburkholderia sp. Kb1A]
MSRVKTLEEHWQCYRESAVDPDACAHELVTLRLAFYAGIGVVLDYTNLMAGLDESGAMMLLELLHRQMNRFRRAANIAVSRENDDA